MTPSEMTAVVVTRGDRDITAVLESLEHFGELVVWNNGLLTARDDKVYGRYLGIGIAKHEVVYAQDDDCTVDTDALIREWEPGKIVANMPLDRRAEYQGTDICLVGWGMVLERKLVTRGFDAWDRVYARDELFLRECDRIFTYLNRERIKQVEVPFSQRYYAFGNDRMGTEMRHRTDFLEVRRRLARLRMVGELRRPESAA